VSKELKMLLIAFLLILVGIVVIWWENQNCYQVEYQDLQGSHTVQVCDQEGE
jgi:flagellar biosynthesis/type III secretory pathway M-ring protein FliF/YscJ